MLARRSLLAMSLSWLIAAPAHAAPAPKVTLVHLRSGERLVVQPDALPSPTKLNLFLRCRSTKHYTHMDPRLIAMATRAALHFGKRQVLIVSAFRSAELNVDLYRRGHKVALRSRHMAGQALDLRLGGVAIEKLCRYFRGLKAGGVGCYRRLSFVHIDTDL